MNKAELIDAMAAGAGISKADAKKSLDAFIGATTGALKKGDRVALVGFGSFSVSKRAARKGRNPQTGKEINIAAKKVVKFKAGAELGKKVGK
jgi:DNA-binding protein HU-beta